MVGLVAGLENKLGLTKMLSVPGSSVIRVINDLYNPAKKGDPTAVCRRLSDA